MLITLRSSGPHTTIPIPEALAWTHNPVCVEYIIMETAPGIQLFQIWDDVTKADQPNLIEGLTSCRAIPLLFGF